MDSNARKQFHDVVVIGAGVCGLAVAHRLKRQGVQAIVFDQAERVAEPWRRRHPQLQMNTHRRLSRLPGLALPRSEGAFVRRDAVIEYLEEYERRFGLPVAYRVRVNRLDRVSGSWKVQTSVGPYRARHVVVATGRERVPVIPQWPGTDAFAGRVIHAADFDRADAYRDRRVLVVGAGNSGTDVLNHLVQIRTRQLWVSVRHGPAVIPTRFVGFPVQRLAALMGRLPVRLGDAMMAAAERLAFGDLRRLGLPRHPDGAATRLTRDGVAPAADDGFVAALKAGRVAPVAAVQRFEGARVVLNDGTTLEPDIVICATGYRPGLESMLGHLGVLDKQGLPRPAGDDAYLASPGLWLIGMWPRFEGNFYAARMESRRIANGIFKSLRASGRTYQPADRPRGLHQCQRRGCRRSCG